MRCRTKQVRRVHLHPCRRTCVALVFVTLVCAALGFSHYVNTRWKPVLYDMAEYEARAAVAEAMNRAVAGAMAEQPALYSGLYRLDEGSVQLDAAAAGRARAALVAAVNVAVAALPETERSIPYGSLTDDSLLSGLGPRWRFSLHPQGYVQGTITRQAEVIGVNTTHYSAALQLETVVNMILNSKKNTLTVRIEVPLADVVLCGGTPAVYATTAD